VERFMAEVKKVCAYLATSRPTAVNLFWALERMENIATANTHLSISQLKDRLLEEAKEIHREDEEINRQIGEHALTLFHDGMGVLTHCNA
ncbi:S-methyl-5-thioribose-1-phosphate isomerase, partial [Klebsiella pneumoniae]|nr:S-methyl-5-thioribose-1-phosphate isomerase [Klebsiella pneumoniae]